MIINTKNVKLKGKRKQNKNMNKKLKTKQNKQTKLSLIKYYRRELKKNECTVVDD